MQTPGVSAWVTWMCWPTKPAARRLLGYLPQEFGVYPRVTAQAMLEHWAVLKGVIARGERNSLVEALLQGEPRGRA